MEISRAFSFPADEKALDGHKGESTAPAQSKKLLAAVYFSMAGYDRRAAEKAYRSPWMEVSEKIFIPSKLSGLARLAIKKAVGST